MNNIIVAERIRELMKDEELNQRELAEKIGVSQGAVSEWLSKRTEPSINSLWLLADFFDVTIDYLVGREKL